MCRVNDPFYNCVFSDWVKVKVLDIDKSGMCVCLWDFLLFCILQRWKWISFMHIAGLLLWIWISLSLQMPPGLPVHWQGEPHIAVNPKPQTVRQGTKVSLRCAAFGIPTPHYQWYRNGQPLVDKTGDTLQVRNKCLLASVLLVTVYTALYLLSFHWLWIMHPSPGMYLQVILKK